jgi:hypothetical protein
MKKHILSGSLAAASVAWLLMWTGLQSSIVGTVSPGDGAESVWAIGAADSTKGIISAGSFSLTVKPGTYKLFVDAKGPYKDVLLENLEVKQNQPLDVGEIVLQR